MKKNPKYESEINFKSVFSSPLRLFGYVYFYFFAIFLVIGIYFVKNIENISLNTVPVSFIDSLNIVRDIALKQGGIKPAVDISQIDKPTPETIALGKDKFKTVCSSCHGETGLGDGPAGAALNPKARNFTQTDGWTNGRNFSSMFKTLHEGIAKNGMAAYEYLPVEERIAIIHFIRTFATFPEITKDEIATLDATYKLSEGKVDPNNVPIAIATKKLVSEFKSIPKADSLAGNLVFEQFVADKGKAINVFVNNFSNENQMTSFVSAVSNNPVLHGYKSEILSISNEDWNQLFKYMLSFSKS